MEERIKIELTKKQIKYLFDLICHSNFSGMVVEEFSEIKKMLKEKGDINQDNERG